MRTAGVFLIFAAVALRGFVVFSGSPQLATMVALLAVYGFLLAVETWITHNEEKEKRLAAHSWRRPAYLLLQSALVLLLLAVSTLEDYLALLFIPLCLEAVSFYGQRIGYLWIAFFSLTLTGALFFSDEGPVFGLAMGIFYSSICFLFGGFVLQVRKAEAAHLQNQRMYNQLQSAHSQLQGYADQVANLAVEQERNRLARDLHDSVTQTVFSMNLAAQSARLLLVKNPQRVPEQLLHIQGLAAGAMSEIQSLVSQLKPRSVLEEGLPGALRRLAGERQARDGLQIVLEIYGQAPLADGVASGLYFIAHEALVNVAKHSGSCEAAIRLYMSEGGSYLEIQDHGIGFEPHAVLKQPGHLGLVGMSERAQEIGWELAVESQPGQGTCIRVMESQAAGVVLNLSEDLE